MHPLTNRQIVAGLAYFVGLMAGIIATIHALARLLALTCGV